MDDYTYFANLYQDPKIDHLNQEFQLLFYNNETVDFVLCYNKNNIRIDVISRIRNDIYLIEVVVRQFDNVNNPGIFKIDTGAFTTVCPFIGDLENLIDYHSSGAGGDFVAKIYFGTIYLKNLSPVYSNILHIDNELKLLGNNYLSEKSITIKYGVFEIKD